MCSVVIREGRLEIHTLMTPTVVTSLRNFMLIGNLIRMLLWIRGRKGGGSSAPEKEKHPCMQSRCITTPSFIFLLMVVSVKHLKSVLPGEGFCAM